MKYRMLALFLGAALLLFCLILPQTHPSGAKPFQQHKMWPNPTAQLAQLEAQGVFATHLPILILDTQGRHIPGYLRSDTRELNCDWSLIHQADGVNQLDTAPVQTGQALLSIRGNSSRDYPKKQYTMKTIAPDGASEAVSLLGMPAESSWVLNGSYIDPSLIRNYMLYNLSGELMEYAPRCRLCEVFTTDPSGIPQYQGVYTLIEKIKVSSTRLDLEKYEPGQKEPSFLLQMNSHIDSYPLRHLKPDGVNYYSFDLMYPDFAQLDDDGLLYIQQQLLQFEKSMYDSARSGDWRAFNSSLDLDSFVDYYLINEFFQNLDAGSRSTYLYKGTGGLFSIGPVWDFDGAFNNFADVEEHVDYLKVKSTFYYRNLFQDPLFVSRCLSRYQELRRTILSEDFLLDYIDACAAYLEAPARRNSQRWYPDDPSAYTDELQKMKLFVQQRGAWMDENFAAMCDIIK